MFGTIAIEQYLEESGAEIPENSLTTRGPVSVARICRDATQNVQDVDPETVDAFVRSLPNWVASREIESRNVHMPDGYFDYELFTTEDPETGTLFKFSFDYKNNPRHQYEGSPIGGDITGDEEKYKRARHGRPI